MSRQPYHYIGLGAIQDWLATHESLALWLFPPEEDVAFQEQNLSLATLWMDNGVSFAEYQYGFSRPISCFGRQGCLAVSECRRLLSSDVLFTHSSQPLNSAFFVSA